MSSKITSVSQFVLAIVPSLVHCRVVDSAFLMTAPPPLPKGIAGPDLVFALMAKPFDRATLAAELQVSRIVSNPEWNERNSSVTLTPKKTSKLVGSLGIWYQRLTLDFVFKNMTIPQGVATHVHDLLPAFNERTGLNLGPDDLRNDLIPVLSKSFKLRAGLFSYFFLPNTTATIKFADVQLSDVIKVKQLNGFIPPSAPLGQP